MNLTNNPYVIAEMENLKRQFGGKTQLNLDEYCELMSIKRRKASCHVRAHGVPFVKVGERKMHIPVDELAVYLARKKAEREGGMLVAPVTKEDMKNRRGLVQRAHKQQLAGG